MCPSQAALLLLPAERPGVQSLMMIAGIVVFPLDLILLIAVLFIQAWPLLQTAGLF